MESKKKTKIISINIQDDFPLSGKELKKILENIRVFIIAVNEPDKYNAWIENNKKEAENLDKLLIWSTNQNVNAKETTRD